METTDIKGHLVLVTGAASGIGKEIATSFIKRGAIIAACDKNISALQAIKNEVSNKDFHIFEVDFVNEDSIINCVSKVESDLGPLKAV
ncbi:MAG: SDR family NAD(P)-dependent oxidoreductase, partial [Actinobacteria bacterium]|nr:SDR family NAD(P)-dependent oxidoreductase [Actinomycetota bacterium]